MSHIHVCLVSEQPIPNLTTVLQFKPDTVVLLKTKEMVEKASFLEKVIKERGFDVHSETIEAYDINNIINVSESLIKRCRDCRVTLNITGGTKIGTLGTFQAFYTNDKEIFYVDTKDNKILSLSKGTEQTEIPIDVKISISDYLAVYGFEITSYVKDDSYIYVRKDLTHYFAQTISSMPNFIPKLNFELHPYDENSPLPINASIPIDKNLHKLIVKLPGVALNGKNGIVISDHNSLMYLKGFWFEEYVYMIARSLNPDEIKLNVKGNWVTKARHTPKNEFDIMLSKGNRLFCISCKTANPDRKVGSPKHHRFFGGSSDEDTEEGIGRQFLYELVSLSDRALGLFGKRMLASARQIKDPAVRERARILNVELVDGKNIQTLKENLKQWLNK